MTAGADGAWRDLAESMDIVARPGVSVEVDGDDLVIHIGHPDRPGDDLMTFTATPREDDWTAHYDDLIRAFEQFSDVAVTMVEHVEPGDLPLGVAQDLHNKAIVNNDFGWYDVLRLRFGYVEPLIDRWLN
jgi:hypothetical protein